MKAATDAPGLGVERLEQSYRRVDDEQERALRVPRTRVQVETVLLCDASGLVLEYPRLAIRVL